MCVPRIGSVHIRTLDEDEDLHVDVRRLWALVSETAGVFPTEEYGGAMLLNIFILSFKIKACLFLLKTINSGATAFEARLINLESLK